MNSKIKVLHIAFLLLTNIFYSQVNDTVTVAYVAVQNYEIELASIEKIQNPKTSDYQGSYHFGESEGESQLDILFSNGKLYARTDYYNWEVNNWVAKLDRLPIRYSSDKVIIDSIEYELALSDNEKGLVSHFYEHQEGKTHHYIQFNPDGLLEEPKGKYPESGFVKLTVKDVKSLSKWELKLMRNELFARQGHVFKKGGEMDAYFSKQEWYKSIPKKGNLNLNTIEKYNIELIAKLEQSN